MNMYTVVHLEREIMHALYLLNIGYTTSLSIEHFTTLLCNKSLDDLMRKLCMM